MSRINALVDSMLGELAPMRATDRGDLPDGKVRHVIVADKGLLDFVKGRGGKYAAPLVAVAYIGAPKAGFADTGKINHKAVNQLNVFVLVQNAGGIDSELAGDGGLWELTDAVIDRLAGRTLIARTRDGAAILQDGAERHLAEPLEWVEDMPYQLPKEGHDKGLRCQIVRFACVGRYTPERDETAIWGEELTHVDVTADPRPGEEPETPEADLVEFVADLEDPPEEE